MKELYTGHSRQELERILGISVTELPYMDTPVMTLSWEGGLRPLYVVKTDTARSIRELSERAELVEAEKGSLGALKEALVYWEQFLLKEKAAQKNGGFRELCSCLESRSFTGVLLLGLFVSLKKPEAAGAPSVLKDAEFETPFVQWSGVDFSGGRPVFDSSVCKGVLSLRRSVGLAAFFMRRTDVFFRQGEISYSAAVCQVKIKSLFSAETTDDQIVELYGGYGGADTGGRSVMRYRLALMDRGMLTLSGCGIKEVRIKTAEAVLEAGERQISLSLTLGGDLLFSTLGDSFDPLSYGSGSGEGLPFSGLELSYLVQDGELLQRKAGYGKMKVEWEKAVCREGSFAAGFAFKQVNFLSHEQAGRPEQAGFRRITVPYGQKELPGEWYGLVFRMEMMQGVDLELLFAFGTDAGQDSPCVYAGARLGAFGAGQGFGVNVAGLFRIGFQSIGIAAKDKGSWQILMKGLSVGMFQLSFPGAGCDIVLTAGRGEDGRPCNAWYAVYDNRKGNGCK